MEIEIRFNLSLVLYPAAFNILDNAVPPWIQCSKGIAAVFLSSLAYCAVFRRRRNEKQRETPESNAPSMVYITYSKFRRFYFISKRHQRQRHNHWKSQSLTQTDYAIKMHNCRMPTFSASKKRILKSEQNEVQIANVFDFHNDHNSRLLFSPMLSIFGRTG